MATYTPHSAFEYCKKFISNMDLERLTPAILDDINKMFWVYAPWRWSLGLFPQITLVSNTQDYPVTLPDDFLFLYDILQLDGKTTRHLKPTAIYPQTGTLRGGAAGSAAIMNISGTDTLRIDPTVGSIPATAPTQKLIAIYKKTSPTIDASTMYDAGALEIPDEWFWVFREGVLWKAMQWAQDPRAGDTKVQAGQAVHSGQRASFEAAMAYCAQQEKLYDLDLQEAAR
jgi:hypothetical protein